MYICTATLLRYCNNTDEHVLIGASVSETPLVLVDCNNEYADERVFINSTLAQSGGGSSKAGLANRHNFPRPFPVSLLGVCCHVEELFSSTAAKAAAGGAAAIADGPRSVRLSAARAAGGR